MERHIQETRGRGEILLSLGVVKLGCQVTVRFDEIISIGLAYLRYNGSTT